MRFVMLALLLAVAAACTPSKLEETMLTPRERTFVRDLVKDIARGDLRAVKSNSQPDLARQLDQVFDPMRGALPEAPHELLMTNANVNLAGNTRSMNAVYSVKGKGGWALLEVVVQTENARTSLNGVYVTPFRVDPVKANAFSLAHGGVAGWAMIAAMGAAVGITFAALVRIWRRPDIFGRRWLWMIAVIFGVTIVRMNWSTRAFSFEPVMVQLFSAGAYKTPIFAPWILSVSIPLFALIALFRRGRRVVEGASKGG